MVNWITLSQGIEHPSGTFSQWGFQISSCEINIQIVVGKFQVSEVRYSPSPFKKGEK